MVEPKEYQDSNLMWLLDFKVDSLFGRENLVGDVILVPDNNGKDNYSQTTQVSEILGDLPGSQTEVFTIPIQEINDNVANFENVQSTDVDFKVVDGKSGKPRRKRAFKRDSENSQNFSEFAHGDKPNNTYTQIISRALAENPQGLTVSEIYEWIS